MSGGVPDVLRLGRPKFIGDEKDIPWHEREADPDRHEWFWWTTRMPFISGFLAEPCVLEWADDVFYCVRSAALRNTGTRQEVGEFVRKAIEAGNVDARYEWSDDRDSPMRNLMRGFMRQAQDREKAFNAVKKELESLKGLL